MNQSQDSNEDLNTNLGFTAQAKLYLNNLIAYPNISTGNYFG